MTEDPNVELAVRRARMRAAKADPARSSIDAVAAMAAGAGAEIVAKTQRAREALAARMERWDAMTPEQQRATVAGRIAAR